MRPTPPGFLSSPLAPAGFPASSLTARNGLLFEPDDPEDFLAQVTRLREHRELAAQLAQKGREAAQARFDWSVILNAHERVFAEVLSPPPGRAGSNGDQAGPGARARMN